MLTLNGIWLHSHRNVITQGMYNVHNVDNKAPTPKAVL